MYVLLNTFVKKLACSSKKRTNFDIMIRGPSIFGEFEIMP